MDRIVGRDILRCHVGGGYELVKRDLGNGHREYRVAPVKTWELVGELSDQAYADRLDELQATQEERKEANLERAAMRAKQRVRLLCKVAGVDTLLTLTYAANMCDWALLKRHMKEFNRRMAKLIPGWYYIAAFEKQKRGAWHVHMAVHRLPRELTAKGGVKVKSFNVIRAVWRTVTGELGGNIDVQARKRNSQRAPSRIAAYLSKYMTKAFAEGDPWSNRFTSSRGITVPPPERLRFIGYSMMEIAQVVFDDMPEFISEQIRWGLNRWKDSLWWILDTNIRPPKPECWEGE
ncbi:MAG: hypothetical protein KIS62_05575 [Ramlibacter sp.]|nr:hypothetical protein [Ramlibacter sp.]